MKCNDWPVAVCSWSLRTDIGGVADALRRLGIDQVNLALKPALREGGQEYLAAVDRHSWTISAATIGFPQEDYSTLESIRTTGGIVPDEYWPQNRQTVVRAAEITADLGAPYLTLHAGFLDTSETTHARKVRDRLLGLADVAADRGLVLLLETGQETAGSLRALLEELKHPALGVNFDPANMILYDKGDPVAALRALGPWIRHVHIKDAVRTTQPGTWGTEVPWGEGQVGGEPFLMTLKEIGFAGTLAIEREGGDNRYGDIQLAAERLVKAGRHLEAGGHR